MERATTTLSQILTVAHETFTAVQTHCAVHSEECSKGPFARTVQSVILLDNCKSVLKC